MSVGIEASRARVTKKLLKWGATAISMPIDFALGTAIINFSYKGNSYTFRYKDKNGTEALSKLSWSLCRLIDCDTRKILPFAKTAKEFLALNAPEGTQPPNSEQTGYLPPEIFSELDLTWQASNDEIKKQFKKLATMFHPDRALNEDDKKFYEQKMAKLNEAYTQIKKVRGIQ